MECSHEQLANSTKIFVNGNWIGAIDEPFELIDTFKLYKRNGLIPIFTSISFNYQHNEINIYTDAGRLTRPIYYIDENKKESFNRKDIMEKIKNQKQ
jgi:DNA-directed RNA polymerase beta subunit